MALYEDIEIEQGSTFRYLVTLTSNNGLAYDLAGHTFAAQVKKNYASSSVSATFTAETTTNAGQIRLSLTDEQTALIKAGRYVFDVLIQNDAGEKYRVIEGIVTVSPSVTSM